jgi:DNA modification methylase
MDFHQIKGRNFVPTIDLVGCDKLVPNPRNARVHSKKQINQIKESIREFGFLNPVLIDGNNMIVSGHARVDAAKALGLREIPCVRIDHLSEMEARAYCVADNKHSDNSQFDQELLNLEINEIAEYFKSGDLECIGFSTAEVDRLYSDALASTYYAPEVDGLPLKSDVVVRCNPGDIWGAGAHRVICGDSRDITMVKALLDGESAQMSFSDPPYNVPIKGNVSGKGHVRHDDFVMASGEMSPEQFTAFLATILENTSTHCCEGAILFVCMGWYGLAEIIGAIKHSKLGLINLCVWQKDMPGMGSLYRSRHELVFVLKNGSGSHINNVQLGRHGRNRTNVWEYPAINSRKSSNRKNLALHPTAKPVEMVADAIRDVSVRNGIVLDLFGGSGSTLIAAEQTGRRARICEIDAHYCDVILSRYEAFAKDDVELLACGWPRQLPKRGEGGSDGR